jgi:integrase
MTGKVFKRCGCTPPPREPSQPHDKPRHRIPRQRCPRLNEPGHGSWWYQLELPHLPDAPRNRLRRGGFTTPEGAQHAVDHIHALLQVPDPDDVACRIELAALIRARSHRPGQLPSIAETRQHYHDNLPLTPIPTLAEWLGQWLATRTRLRPNTRCIYETHIRLYLKPYLGHIRLDRLRIDHITDMFAHIDEHNALIAAARASHDPGLCAQTRWQRHVGTATKHRIRAELRSALNGAITQRLITTNPARYVELPELQRPVPLIWTPARVTAWHTTGRRPSKIMVWTPQQTGRFLDHTRDDPLYPLYHLIAFRGLRRGEACGLHWADLDLDTGALHMSRQLLLVKGELMFGQPKSRAGNRDIALDHHTVRVLRAHRIRQLHHRITAGPHWPHTDLVFTTEHGDPIRPDLVSTRFQQLSAEAGLPPIRLHDLRHGAATLMLAAGVNTKVIQETLGHSRYTTTLDIYTSVLPTLAHAAAEATAAMIPRNAA